MFIPWFGELPFYAEKFLTCCEKSKNIMWVVHSDQQRPLYCPDCVKWFLIGNVSERIAAVFGAVTPNRIWGHKLCDLKPFWHVIFKESCVEKTHYRGWCDWDVLHDLSAVVFDFGSAKFTSDWQCSPLFIVRCDSAIEVWPVRLDGFLTGTSCAWDEIFYLRLYDSKVLQNGLTPECDLFEPAKYAVHMYRAKDSPALYEQWIRQYFKNT